MQPTTLLVEPGSEAAQAQGSTVMPPHDLPPDSHSCSVDDRRRTLRLRKSSLVTLKLDKIDRPSIKIAETLDEYQQAFKLAYESYVEQGYLAENKEHPYHYSPFSLLPETCIFIFKSYHTVIASLTEIFDSSEFGLPIDELYKQELDTLRDKGRKIVELASFVTLKEFRMRNIMIYLCKIMVMHSQANKINDICIMVNPKHVRFYTTMFFFEAFGKTKFYEKVQAPAVALRLNMDTIEEHARRKYARFEVTEDLHHFFYRTNTTLDKLMSGPLSPRKRQLDEAIYDFFQAKTR